jgi:hypothetical protein
MLRTSSLIAGLVAGLFLPPLWQDPVKPPVTPPAVPPSSAPTAPPDTKAATPEPGATKDVPGRPRRHAIEGVFEVRLRVLNGKTDPVPSRGYLVITNRHLFMSGSAPGPDPKLPLLRTTVRTWTQQADGVRTTMQLGWFTDKDGTTILEPTGTQETRRIELIQGGVRVMQDDRNWIEFDRVE